MTREYIKENWKVIGIYFEGRMEGTRYCFSLESGGDIRKEDQKNLPSKPVDWVSPETGKVEMPQR